MTDPIRDPQLVEQIYATIAHHDNTYDGIYYTGVHTTGIFCRPSCRSRTQAKHHLLDQDPKPLTEIARLTGFSSPAYFSTVFLKITGVSPSEYRNRWSRK